MQTEVGHNCNVAFGCPICSVIAVRDERDEARAESEALRDLLARILASSEDGSLMVPDVVHAMEASIKDALAPRKEQQ